MGRDVLWCVGLADPKASQQETRASAYNAGKRASDAVSAVTELRRDVDRLHGSLDGLRREVGEVLALLHARVQGDVDVEGDESTTAEPEPLSGQRHVPEEELAPAGAESPAAAEVLADMETAEQSQDEDSSAVAQEEPETEASAAQGAPPCRSRKRRNVVRCGRPKSRARTSRIPSVQRVGSGRL